MCVETFGKENVEGYFMYMVKGLRCVEDHVDLAVKRHGIKLHKVPHYDLGAMYQNALFMPPRRQAFKFRRMHPGDIEQMLVEKTGIEWFAYGHRMHDSLERRGMLNKCQGMDPKRKVVFPLWQWVPRDVYAYLRAKKIPTPTQLGGWNSSGVALTGSCLRVIRDRFPADWQRLLVVFPYAEAAIFSEDMKHAQAKAAGGNASPRVRSAAVEISVSDLASEPSGPQGR